jgi:PAS domain S-box-containing protein
MSTYAVPNVEDRIRTLTETLSRALAALDEVGHTHVSRGADTGIEEAKRAALALADEAQRQIAERYRIEGALRDSERRLKAVLDNATVAVFLVDRDRRCLYMNAAAERLTGYQLAQTQGRRLHEVIHHSRPDGRPYPVEECPIDRTLPESDQQQGEELFVHRDGSFYPVAFTASPIRDESARVIGTIIEVRDTR